MQKTSLQRIPLWQWPAVLALDTPIVAALWLALFARSLYAPLETPHYMMVAGSLWLFCILNRGLRAEHYPDERNDPRITFFRMEKWPILVVTPFVVVSLTLLWTNRLSALEQWSFLVFATIGAGYLICRCFYLHETEAWLPREIACALAGGGAVAVFSLTNGIFPPLYTGGFLLLLILLFIVAFRASATLEWEARTRPDKPSPVPIPGGNLKTTTTAAVLAALALALSLLTRNTPVSPICIAAAAAAVNVALLARYASAFSGMAARVLSRAVLLTPIVPLALP